VPNLCPQETPAYRVKQRVGEAVFGKKKGEIERVCCQIQLNYAHSAHVFVRIWKKMSSEQKIRPIVTVTVLSIWDMLRR
jgi:hypothetical protein